MRRECRERFPHHRFQRKPLVSDPVTHVPWCLSGIADLRWRGKRSRHSRRVRDLQFDVSGKRPILRINVYYMSLSLPMITRVSSARIPMRLWLWWAQAVSHCTQDIWWDGIAITDTLIVQLSYKIWPVVVKDTNGTPLYYTKTVFWLCHVLRICDLFY